MLLSGAYSASAQRQISSGFSTVEAMHRRLVLTPAGSLDQMQSPFGPVRGAIGM